MDIVKGLILGVSLALAVSGEAKPQVYSNPLWAVGTVEIVCEGPYTLSMRGGFPWDGSYQPIGSPYTGGFGATILVEGMAEGRESPPYSQASPVAFLITPFEPVFDCELCDIDGDGDVDLWDVGTCQRFMTGPLDSTSEAEEPPEPD